MTRTDLCVQPHDTEWPAAPPLRLCQTCYDRLRGDLADLGRLYVELERVLPAGSSPRYGQRVTGSSSRPLPVSVPVVEVRDQVRHDMAWWAQYVATRRRMRPPAGADVPMLARWLAEHAEWIARDRRGAADLPPVIRELAGRARSLAYPSGVRRIEIGPCIQQVDGERCTGTVHATVRKEGDPRPSLIYCTGPCGAQYQPESWRRFGRDYLRERMAG
ncbi:MAG TPA: hypothetical protein VF158_03245 [Longimicrobiales bacterium]